MLKINTNLETRTKILIMMCFGILVILLDSPTALICCFFTTLILLFLFKPTFKQYRLMVIFLFLTTWGLIYSQGMFYNIYPRTVLFTIIPAELPIIGEWTGGIRIYREGLYHGIIQSLRFNTTLVLGCYIVWSTQPRDLLLAFGQLRIPGALAFMVTTALHFIPVIANEAATVIRSQRLRGFRYFQLNLFKVFHGAVNSFRPIIAGNIRHASNLGDSVESRGFSPENTSQRTSLRDSQMERLDYCILIILAISMVSVIVLKILYFCYANNIYYGSWLRGVYTFTREIL
ncbi:energy-coupling factor transporter transmembrane protein EcfT [Candidatus Poribacteria bacterium]|nr:energy-coupling factor transporter transmembrane protein EcfT [Candidatus Poribacteria bacterium]